MNSKVPSSPRLTIKEVTPDDARRWLERDVRPQRLGPRYIRAYAREMREGRWRLNGETIIFSETGTLLDGRKRLHACVESNSPFLTIVVENISEEGFKTIDALRSRKASDILFIRGEPFYRTLSSVPNVLIRYYKYYQHSAPLRMDMTSRDTLFVLDLRPEIRASVVKTSGLKQLGWHSVAAAVHHLASRVDPARADAFFERVVNGPTEEGDPAGLLRRAFETATGSGQERMLALTILAWNAEYAGKSLKYLRFRQEGDRQQRFPTVAGLPPDDGTDLEQERPSPVSPPVNPDQLSITIEHITPDQAERLIEAKEHNRNIVTRVVDKYARDMRTGNWALNGQTIKISKSGKLLDGQHRCCAAVKTGKSFDAIVVRGLPDEVFDTLDAGPVRSLGEVLATRGEKNTNALAAALQKLWLYQQGFPQLHTIRGSHAELLRVLDEHPEIRNSTQYVLNRARDVIPGGIAAATHYLGGRLNREKADEFIDRIGDGIGLGKNDPIRLLRELLRRDEKRNRGSLRETEKWALTIKAMNAFFAGSDMRLLVWRTSSKEAFPRVLERASQQGRRSARAEPLLQPESAAQEELAMA